MNWIDDQIEKLSSVSLAMFVWYQKSCNWYQFLVPVSGQYVMGISTVHFYSKQQPINRLTINAQTVRHLRLHKMVHEIRDRLADCVLW